MVHGSQAETSAFAELESCLRMLSPLVQKTGRVHIGDCVRLLRQRQAGELAARLRRASSARNGAAHPDADLRRDVEKFIEAAANEAASNEEEIVHAEAKAEGQVLEARKELHAEDKAEQKEAMSLADLQEQLADLKEQLQQRQEGKEAAEKELAEVQGQLANERELLEAAHQSQAEMTAKLDAVVRELAEIQEQRRWDKLIPAQPEISEEAVNELFRPLLLDVGYKGALVATVHPRAVTIWVANKKEVVGKRLCDLTRLLYKQSKAPEGSIELFVEGC